jgi:hypothetical protein
MTLTIKEKDNGKEKDKPPNLPFDKPENEAERPTEQQLQFIGNTANTDQRISEFKKYLELAEEKTVITLLEKLVNEKYLEFITEYPSTQYTKAMTKLNTWRTSIMEVYNLGEEDADIIVRDMCIQFMLKMTSHKRRRSHELVNGASRQDTGQQILNENKGLKKFLGIK